MKFVSEYSLFSRKCIWEYHQQSIAISLRPQGVKNLMYSLHLPSLSLYAMTHHMKHIGIRYERTELEVKCINYITIHISMERYVMPFIRNLVSVFLYVLTHCNQGKIAAISQPMFLNTFSWMKMYELRFHWSLSINNIPALVQIMAWHCPGAKPLSESMLDSLLTKYVRHLASMSW